MNILKKAATTTLPVFIIPLIFTALSTNFFTGRNIFFYTYFILLMAIIPFFVGMLILLKLKKIGFNRPGNIILSSFAVALLYFGMFISVPSGPDVGMGGVVLLAIHMLSGLYFIIESIFQSKIQSDTTQPSKTQPSTNQLSRLSILWRILLVIISIILLLKIVSYWMFM